MSDSVKQKMIEGAIQLLATKGLQATSFSEVLKLTGAPRGSIYHHFPEGKDQLVAAAIEVQGARVVKLMETKRGATAVEITRFFLEAWRSLLIKTDFRAGCSVLAITVASDSELLLKQASAIFAAWQVQLADMFILAGVAKDLAGDFSAELISASEGAVVMARAQRGIQPFERVARRLTEQAGQLFRE